MKLFADIARDLRSGVRQLARTPVVSLVAILTLAFGIGSNTAIFSVLNTALLQKLPVAHPEELRTVVVRTKTGWFSNVPAELFREVRQSPRSFAAVFAYWQDDINVGEGAEFERLPGQWVSGSYYSGLGIPMYLGRPITEADERGNDRVAVISYAYWKRRFAADPAVIGRTISVDGALATIVGITPPGFFGMDRGVSPDVTVPLDTRPDSQMASVWLTVRLKPSVSDEQALAEADLALQRAHETLLPQWKDYRASEREAILSEHAGFRTGDKGQGYAMHSYVEPLRVLILLSGVVLLIACVNIANLQLGRCQARVNEIGVRLALGAGRWRLIRQLLTESAVLAAAGIVAGIALAYVLHRSLLLLLMDASTAQSISFTLDSHLLVFEAFVALLTLAIFGVAPALRATKVDVWSTLKRDLRAGGGHGMKLAKALVVAQVAAALALLYGAGLLERTFRNLNALDTGMEMENVLLMKIGMSTREFKVPELPSSEYQQITDRVAQVPGVLSAAFAGDYGFSAGGWNKSVWVEGLPPEQSQESKDNVVSPGFFSTVGLPLRAGRDFNATDSPESPKVVIVNEAFARRYFPGQNPIGRHVGDSGAKSILKYEVIGVVTDARTMRLRDEAEPFLYQALLQEKSAYNAVLHVRTRGNPALLQQRIVGAIHASDSRLPVYAITTSLDRFSLAIHREKMMAYLGSFFSILALLLTAVGLYGVIAYSVVRRIPELGVRLALGASRADVTRMVLRETLVLIGAGSAFGLVLALAAGPLLRSMLFGVRAQDAVTSIVCAALLAVIGIAAGALPARRAGRLDPMAALRME